MAEWQRAAATTISQYTKGAEDETMRRRILLNRAEKLGNIDLDESGLDYNWQVQKANRQLQVNNGTQIVNFAPQNIYARATLPWTGYVIADMVTKREQLMNKGAQAMIKFWSGIAESLTKDMRVRFSEELYKDNTAAGNDGRMAGFNTMIGTITQTYDSTSATATSARTKNAADIVGVPVQSYAGLSTIPGAAGGTWTGRWPEIGFGDSLFDYWSPLIVNYTSTQYDGSSTTWLNNCVEAVRFLLMFINRNTQEEGDCDLILLPTNMFRQYKSKLDPTQRVTINQGSDERKYGIRDGFYQDGVEITHEAGVPTNQGFAFNMEQFKVMSMQGKLFDADGPVKNPTDRSYRTDIDFLGNERFSSPRCFGTLLAIA